VNEKMIYLDMDGVLANFPKDGAGTYRNVGFFERLEVIEEGCTIYTTLKRLGYPVTVLTKCPDLSHSKSEKTVWLERKLQLHTGGVKVIFVSEEKKKSDAIGRKAQLQSTDILIDDYNKNLVEWQRAGGTALKFLNGQNDPKTWSGISVKNIHELLEVLR